jgi:hypothetical protein
MSASSLSTANVLLVVVVAVVDGGLALLRGAFLRVPLSTNPGDVR